jgi:hypothetical protein
MPPIRTTPAKHRFDPTPFVVEDDGFNPQWALNPEDPIFKSTLNPFASNQSLFPPEPEPVTESLPAPEVRVSYLTPEMREM